MPFVYRDRREAGRRLAETLRAYARRPDVLVLGLPRGGVPVAYEVAQALGAPLDVFVVRKLGVPGHEELAMGAIASGGVQVLDRETIVDLRVSQAEVDRVIATERRELERRERAYRAGPPPDVKGRTVILVDDGLATGASMAAAVAALQRRDASAVVVAAPVGAPVTCDGLRRVADACVCAQTPPSFHGVGEWYADFEQTTDHQVRSLLAAAALRRLPGAASPSSTV